MNITDTLKKTREEVNGEIGRLLKVRDDLDKMIGAGGESKPAKAPEGSLKKAILGVLAQSKVPMSPEAIRAALKAAKYPYSLNPATVSSYLWEMKHEDKTVTQSGVKRASKYAVKR